MGRVYKCVCVSVNPWWWSEQHSAKKQCSWQISRPPRFPGLRLPQTGNVEDERLSTSGQVNFDESRKVVIRENKFSKSRCQCFNSEAFSMPVQQVFLHSPSCLCACVCCNACMCVCVYACAWKCACACVCVTVFRADWNGHFYRQRNIPTDDFLSPEVAGVVIVVAVIVVVVVDVVHVILVHPSWPIFWFISRNFEFVLPRETPFSILNGSDCSDCFVRIFLLLRQVFLDLSWCQPRPVSSLKKILLVKVSLQIEGPSKPVFLSICFNYSDGCTNGSMDSAQLVLLWQFLLLIENLLLFSLLQRIV